MIGEVNNDVKNMTVLKKKSIEFELFSNIVL